MRAVTRREERDRVGRKKRGGTVEEKKEEKGFFLVGDFSFSLTCPIIVASECSGRVLKFKSNGIKE